MANINARARARVTRRVLAVSCPRNGSGVSTRPTVGVLFATIVLVLFSTSAAFAASYVVPPDDVFIAKADGIIVAHALTSYVRETPGSGMETVTEFTVEESIKGEIAAASQVLVYIPGGVMNGRAKVIPGAPRFADGVEYLLFLSKRPDGGFATTDLALGVFTFADDDLGRRVAVRDDAEIVGWDVDGRPHQEPRRDARRFLDYVRQVARGGSPAPAYRIDSRPLVGSMRAQSESQHRAEPSTVYTATSYTIAITGGSSGPGARWNTFPGAVDWNQGSTQVAAGTTAINTAFSSWNGGGGNVNYRLASQTANPNGIFEAPDGVNNIVFEKNLTSQGIAAFTCSSGGVLGVGGISSASSSLNTQNGESFWTTGEGDVSMNQGVSACIGSSFSAGDFNSAVTHEVGHTLGWRHADKIRDPASSTSCTTDPSLECTSSAIMTAFVTSNLNGNLQAWDQHAVQMVYGAGAPACTPPSISVQPTGSTIASGGSAILSVTATGSTPLSYQWYQGTSGTTTTPVGTNSSSFNTGSLTTTTSYWVRVTGQCSPPADSGTATVTVNPASCTPPSITVPPTGTAITSGQSATLSVSATGTAPLSYQWYQGTSGNTTTPVGSNSSSFNTGALTTTTSYWVRVTGQCSPPADSATATVTVGAACPAVTVGTPTATAVPGGFQLSVVASTPSGGGGLTYRWFSGGVIVGFDNPLTVNPTSSTVYSVVVQNDCGNSTTSPSITVTPSVTCTAPAITTATATPGSIASGGSSTLSVSATGTSLIYQWYVGQPGDATHPVAGGTSATISVSPTQTTTYWVQVSSGCGAAAANSGAIVVTVASSCATPTLTQPPDQLVGLGQIAFLTVSATGTAPLHYAWFQGSTGDTSNPVGTDSATLRTASLRVTATFWVRVTNGCGSSASSNTITITVRPSRSRPSRR